MLSDIKLGEQLEATSGIGAYRRSTYDAWAKYSWPGKVEKPWQLPPRTKDTDLIEVLDAGSKLEVIEVLFDAPNSTSDRGRFVAIHARYTTSKTSGECFAWIVYEGKLHVRRTGSDRVSLTMTGDTIATVEVHQLVAGGKYVPTNISTSLALSDKVAPPSDGLILPTMIVDYHIGRHAFMTDRNDPRFLLDLQKMSEKERKLYENSPTRWSLGRRGWIILGFDEGFIPDSDYTVKFVEVGKKTEWVDIWAASHIETYSPVNYIHLPLSQTKIDDDLYKTHSARTHTNSVPGPYTPKDPTIRANWIPGNWQYVGGVRGVEGGAEVDGPGLGHLPWAKYYYLLIHDSGNAPWVSSRHADGADIVRIGLFPKAELLKKTTYHLLVVDVSASVDSVADVYRATIKDFIHALVKKPGTHRLGLRLLGQRTSTSNPSETWRVKIAELWWIEIKSGKPGVDEVWAQIQPHIVFRGFTPLAAAINAIVDVDLGGGSDGIAAPPGLFVEIVLITDGMPDPKGQFPSEPSKYTKDDRDTTMKMIRGPVRDALIRLKTEGRGGYIPEILGAFSSDGGSKLKKEIFDEYVKYSGDLSKEKNSGLLARVTDLTSKKRAKITSRKPIDHTLIHHTDCLKGGPASKCRIGPGEAKRIMSARVQLHGNQKSSTQRSNSRAGPPGRIRTPHRWSERKERLTGLKGMAREAAHHSLPKNNFETD